MQLFSVWALRCTVGCTSTVCCACFAGIRARPHSARPEARKDTLHAAVRCDLSHTRTCCSQHTVFEYMQHYIDSYHDHVPAARRCAPPMAPRPTTSLSCRRCPSCHVSCRPGTPLGDGSAASCTKQCMHFTEIRGCAGPCRWLSARVDPGLCVGASRATRVVRHPFAGGAP